MSKIHPLGGVWQILADDGILHTLRLPGTLEENNIGHPDYGTEDVDKTVSGQAPEDAQERFLRSEGLLFERESAMPAPAEPILTRYTRKYVYEGAVRISRMLTFEEHLGKRYFFEVERARCLDLLIDGVEVPPYEFHALPSEAVFEVTGRLDGSHMLTIVSDNSYLGLPSEEIRSSAIASDDSETNWNGLLGFIRIREEETFFPYRIRAFIEGGKITVAAEIESEHQETVTLRVSSKALSNDFEQKLDLEIGLKEYRFTDLEPAADFNTWDVGSPGALYDLTVAMSVKIGSSFIESEKTARLGFRTLSSDGSGFYLNGRKFVPLGETHHGAHPETSYAPMDAGYWKNLFALYRAYGLNFVYFKTHFPPHAAFDAADETGMLLFAELSRGEGKEQYLTETGRHYYEEELKSVLRSFGRHPSLFAVSFAGHLDTEEEESSMLTAFYGLASHLAPQCLYTAGRDLLTGDADFRFLSEWESVSVNPLLSGDLPVLAGETSGDEMLPDFTELDLFSGMLMPVQIERAMDLAKKQNRLGRWPQYVRLSGSSLKERVERKMLRLLSDSTLSGLVSDGFQDDPGHGKHPGGLAYAHPIVKRFEGAEPKAFLQGLRTVLPMLLTDRVNFSAGEVLKVPAVAFNVGNEAAAGAFSVRLSASDEDGGTEVFDEAVTFEPALPESEAEAPLSPGERRVFGRVTIDFGKVRIPWKYRQVTMAVSFGKIVNRYLWYVYPVRIPVCPENVLRVNTWNERAVEFLKKGGNVLVAVPDAGIRKDVNWSIRKEHEIFKGLGAEAHSGVRWQELARTKGFLLPEGLEGMITILRHPFDGPFTSPLFEIRVLSGSVLVSALGLEAKAELPEANALLSEIYEYMGSPDFSPAEEVLPQRLQEILGTLQ